MKNFVVGNGRIVCLCVAAIAGLSACSEKAPEVARKPSSEETELEKAARELEEEKKKLEIMAERKRIAEQKTAMEAELAKAKHKEEEARKKREREEKERKLAEVKKRKEIEAIRTALIGTALPELKTSKGKTYKLVEIKNATPANLRIVHQDGAATIPYAELAMKWQMKVHYDMVEAEAYLKELDSAKAERKQVLAAQKKDAQDKRVAAAKTRKEEAVMDLPAAEKKLHKQLEKYINLKKNAEIEYTSVRARRDRLTTGSANWNTAEKQLDRLSVKINQHDDQVRRCYDLLNAKEEARYKRERVRRDEEKRRERAAARNR